MTKLTKTVLKNKLGMEVTLVNFGARMTSVKYPVIDKLQEMLVSYDSLNEYVDDPFYLGATCGTVCNRIANAEFEIDGTAYSLPANDGENTLHGGPNNVSLQYWQLDLATVSSSYAKFILSVADGHNGFPGNIELTAAYTLSEDGQLSIEYTGTTDTKTPINLTNHAYFNLGEKTCFDLELKMASSQFLERGSNGIPTGDILDVDVMGVDFTKRQTIAELVDLNKYKQVKEEAGFDTCFVLDSNAEVKAELRSLKNRIKLSVMTTQPAVQLYTGKFLGAPLRPYQGVCLECQGYVDAPNQSQFPTINVAPNEIYRQKIIYQFSEF